MQLHFTKKTKLKAQIKKTFEIQVTCPQPATTHAERPLHTSVPRSKFLLPYRCLVRQQAFTGNQASSWRLEN